MESAPASPTALPEHLFSDQDRGTARTLTASAGDDTTGFTALPPPGGSTRLATWNASNWRTAAACSNMDTGLFFPTGEGMMAIDQINLAKSVCASCPVRLECLEFAIRTIQNDGIWGGTTEDERRLIKRSRRAAARRAASAANRPQSQAS